MAQLARRFQQSLDFVAAQNQRQLPFAPGKRNAFDGDLPVQGMGVEEAQGANHQHIRWTSILSFLWSGTTGSGECARHRVDRVVCRSAWQTPGWRTGIAGSWSENNGGPGDPPASAVEVGSQQTPFVVTTSQI